MPKILITGDAKPEDIAELINEGIQRYGKEFEIGISPNFRLIHQQEGQMTTPKGIKKLWKNIDWTNQEEKEAFFNKYLKNSKWVTQRADAAVKAHRASLLAFIEQGEVQEGKSKRKLTMDDIIKRLKEGTA